MSNDSDTSEQTTDLTDSIQSRWAYTNDLLAALLIVSLVVVQSYSVILGKDIALNQSYIIATLTAVGWVFGSDLIEKYRK